MLNWLVVLFMSSFWIFLIFGMGWGLCVELGCAPL